MRFTNLLVGQLTLALSLGFGAAVAQAQSAYPDSGKSTRVLVGTSAGGISDTAARKVAQKLGSLMRSSFVVENRDGAGGIIAARALVQAPSDGHTLLLGTTSSSVLAPLTAETPPFKFTDLAAVGLVGGSPMVIYINADVPAKNLTELIALLKRSPGRYSFASAGIGSTAHVTGELFQMRAGVELIHVPFRGGPGVDQAVVAGDVQIAFNAIGPVLPLHKSGKVRLLATFTEKRSELAQEIPSARESGLDMISNLNFYLLATQQTPLPILTALNGAFRQALQDRDFRRELLAASIEPPPPHDLKFASDAYLGEVDQWRTVLKNAPPPRK